MEKGILCLALKKFNKLRFLLCVPGADPFAGSTRLIAQDATLLVVNPPIQTKGMLNCGGGFNSRAGSTAYGFDANFPNQGAGQTHCCY